MTHEQICHISEIRPTVRHKSRLACLILQNQTLTRHNDGLGQAVAAICPRSSAFARSSSSIRRACCLMMMLAVPTSIPSSPCALTGICSIVLLVMLSRLRLITNACSYHTPFDALVSDEIRRKSRFPEDFGWRFACQVADGAHLLERIGVGDAIARYVGDRWQSAQ